MSKVSTTQAFKKKSELVIQPEDSLKLIKEEPEDEDDKENSKEVRNHSTTTFKIAKDKPLYMTNPVIPPLLYCEINPSLDILSPADVCFIFDLTGNMDTYIDNIKKAMFTIIDAIKKEVSAVPRLAFIGFRDIDDGKKQIVKKDFTKNVDEIKKFIDSPECKCFGGNDVCEDLIKPLKEALTFDWKSDLMYVFLLLESPAHGSRYHDPKYSDFYKTTDKHMLLEKLACHYRKNKIILIILSCNDSVKLTIETIKKYYDSPINDLIEIDISDAKDVINEATRAKLNRDILKELGKNFRVIRPEKSITDECEMIIDYEVNMDFPKAITYRQYNCEFNAPSYNYMKCKYSLTVSPGDICKAEVSATKIDNGIYSGWFYMIQKIKNPNNPEEDIMLNSLVMPIKTACTEAKDLSIILEANSFAAEFINRFNVLLGIKNFKILSIKLGEIIECKAFKGFKFFVIQEYLIGMYAKYNNNYGWVLNSKSQKEAIAQAFSHFTYEYSLGSLIIVDIQGIIFKDTFHLGNPVIHSEVYKGHFGGTNCGKVGIMRFFKTHICNEYCKQLGLHDPKSFHDPKNPNHEKLNGILSKRVPDEELQHLYDKFEGNMIQWKKNISNFNSKEKPIPNDLMEKDIVQNFENAVIAGGM